MEMWKRGGRRPTWGTGSMLKERFVRRRTKDRVVGRAEAESSSASSSSSEVVDVQLSGSRKSRPHDLSWRRAT